MLLVKNVASWCFLIKNVSFLPKENSKVLIYCSSINYYLLLFFVIYCTKNDILMPHLLSCWTLWFIVFLLVLLGMVCFFLLCITLESLLLAITHHITNVLKGAFVLLYHFPLGDESLQHDGLWTNIFEIIYHNCNDLISKYIKFIYFI